MAKTNITQRPMVIVSVSTQKWDIGSYQTETGTFMKEGKKVNVKKETLTTGRWAIYGGRYYSDFLLPTGEFKSSWVCHRDHLKFEYPSAKAALKVWSERKTGSCIIRRLRESYYNQETKEVTFDKKVANSWFKNENPLFISNCQYQRAGIWVDPGKDYVTISFYYNNRIQREKCEDWKPAMVKVTTSQGIKEIPMSLRLYNDGTISHFIKGRLRDERVFEEKRTTYRSLDVRFPDLYRLVTTFCDLRSKEIIGHEERTNTLCPETLQILKKCGFPKTYWCWGNTKRSFLDTYDLINFATHVQNKQSSKASLSINDFLKDKPLNEDNLVLAYDGGVIIRVPEYVEYWETDEKRKYNHKPYLYEESDLTKCSLVEAGPRERYRIWISDSGKKRKCQELIHDGTLWKTTMWSSVHFPAPSDRYVNTSDSDLSAAEKLMRARGTVAFNNLVSTTYAKAFELLGCLKRMNNTDFFKQHPELHEGKQLYGLLTAIYCAPKLTETLIKIGYGGWFFTGRSNRWYDYQGSQNPVFALEKVLDRFNVDTRSHYKELSNRSMYGNLGVTKEQFQWIAKTKGSIDFMDFFRRKNFRIPGTQNEYYHDFSAIPVKYLELTHGLVNKLIKDSHGEYYSSANTILRLLERGLCFTDLEKITKKELDINTLDDYLRMRQECDSQYRVALNFNIRDWPLIPSDPVDLQFSHNRILDLYNLGRANAEHFWREEEERRMIERQEKYAERYKKLKTMNYVSDDCDLIIVVPQKLQELVIEGQILHHCVGSFVSSVSEGRDTVVFLRHKDKPNTPYATIALLRSGEAWYIDQAHTAYNGSISEEDLAFLKRWGQLHNVRPESIKLHYGLHCHH